MLGVQIDVTSNRRSRSGLSLLPWAVVAGVEAPTYDDSLPGAQSGLNRIQVWLGDILIDLRRRRQVRPTRAELEVKSEEGLG